MRAKHMAGMFGGWITLILTLACFAFANAIYAQAVNLEGLGINADFEDPDADAANNPDTEANVARNLGPGWTYNLLGGHSADFGVQDPDILGTNAYYTSLTGGFEGQQIGYFNLEAFSAGEMISDPVGPIVAGQTYTLNVGVGARNNTTWSNLRYAIGLRSGSTDLGTFATIDMDPGFAPNNIADLQYSLNVNSEAAGFIGSEARIVIRGINLGTGQTAPAFAQANVDNVRLDGTFAAPNRPLLTINQSTGAITLNKTGTTNMTITGYSITSAAGALNPASWTEIANTYDKALAPTPGNGTVDPDDAWTILSAAGSATDFSEAELETGGNGATLSNANIQLGNAWIRTPFQDLQAELTLADNSTVEVDVVYSGTAIPLGDLTQNGLINGADWTAFKNGQGADFDNLNDVQDYLSGDLDGDGDHDLADFIDFRDAYEEFNGGGSFAAMLAVPEPSSFLMLACGGLLAGFARGRRSKHLEEVTTLTPRIPKAALLIIGIVSLFGWMTRSVEAQTTVAHWSFDTATLTTAGGNITAVADQTGNHHATPGLGGTGGATGTTHLSQPFPLATSSVTGQFGEGVRFAGNNFLLFNNLTELMEGANPSLAPSYTVSMWFRTETAGAAVGSAYAHLGNWGNQPVSAGATRFAYGFGPHTATEIRAQTRRTNPTSGNGGTDGTDIFAPSVATSPAPNNGSWNMLTWTFNTDSGQLLTYFNSALVATTQAAATAAPDYALANSNSAVGGMGIKADSGTFIPNGSMLDEVWVFNGALDAGEVNELYSCNDFTGTTCPITKLRLTIDPTDGDMVLDNATGAPITFNSYEITSADDSLDAAGWNPISNQSINGFPVGDGSSGDGWEAGPDSDAGELTEWYLLGDSTLDDGESINLGTAFETSVGTQDVVLNYALADGTIIRGQVFYEDINAGLTGDYNVDGVVDAADYVVWRKTNINGAQGYTDWRTNFGSSNGGGSMAEPQSSVPEPGAVFMITIGGILMLCCATRTRRQFKLAPAARSLFLLVTSVSALVWGTSGSASAAYTVDRLYQFGDDAGEDAANATGDPDGAGPIRGNVGTGPANVGPGNTLDSVGPSGAFIDMAPVDKIPGNADGTTLPFYIDVSVTGPNLAQARPGAPAGNLGVKLDGVDDYMSGLRFNNPDGAAGTLQFTPPGPNNYNGVRTRGFQLWVYPNSAGSAVNQWIVRDTQQHGFGTNTAGEWQLSYNNATVDSNVDVDFNQWSHVMVVMPGILPNRTVLYVDGVAVAARQSNYTAGTNFSLVVGADTGDTATNIADSDRFNGVVDELEMFVWGSTYDANTNTVTNLGQFEYETDNWFAADALTGLAGDVNQDGFFTQADIDDFVAGWLTENRVNNILVGDLTSILDGDLNFDGITSLADIPLLRDGISGAGSGGFDLTALNSLGAGVPEPGTAVLLISWLCSSVMFRHRRRPPMV
jgi:hypothetical protein